MIYTGLFRNIKNRLYTIHITTENGTDPRELTLGSSPFTSEMDKSDDIIYKPAKYTSAVINIRTTDYLFDIYSKKAQGTKAELLDADNNIVWTGYVTPNLYDMGYVNHKEDILIECIDALSTLQYYKYDTTTKSIISFSDLLRKLISKCNAYTYFYISDNMLYTSTTDNCLINDLYISLQNFFAAKNDTTETDDDVAWTYQEVLEEVCQYIGITAVAIGDSVYFLDYDAIKNGINTYYKFTVNSTDDPSLETISFNKIISTSDYSGNESKISLDNVYNKVTLKDSLYTFENVIPDLFDDITNVTPTVDSDTSVTYGIETTTDGNMEVVLEKSGTTNYACFLKYYNNPNCTFYRYVNYPERWSEFVELVDVNTAINSSADYGATLDYGLTLTSVGSFLMKHQSEVVGASQVITEATKGISSISFDDYILIAWHNLASKSPLYKMFEINSIDTSSYFFGGDNAYLLISGNVIIGDRDSEMYVIPNYSQSSSTTHKILSSGAYLPCKLQWGDYYWNGSGWTTTDSMFNLYFLPDGNSITIAEAFYKTLSIRNTVKWQMGISETGTIITVPPDKSIFTSTPKFSLYNPHKFHNDYRLDSIWLLNFSIKAVIGDPTFGDKNDTDTQYSNVINDSYVKELSDITFKICTWDDKNPNYNAVCYKNGGTYTFLDTVYLKSNALILRPEKQLIYKIVNQYIEPSVKLTLDVRNDNELYGLYTALSNKMFIVDSVNIDYRLNTLEINLIEKK